MIPTETVSTNDNLITENRAEIIELAKEGKAKFFLQFAGQALSYINELQALYDEGLILEDIFEASFKAIDEEMNSEQLILKSTYEHGFDLKKWLKGPENYPPAEYLRNAAISAPLIYLTQIAHYVRFTRTGIPQSDLARYSAGVIGHSQGITAALLIAQMLEGEDFINMFATMLKTLFWQGYHSLEAYPEIATNPTLLARLRENSDETPTPMASFRDIPLKDIEELVSETNSKLPESLHIVIGLKNTPKITVVCGAQESLIKLRFAFNTRFPRLKDNWGFLNVNVPFHSHYLKAASAKLADDFKRLNFDLRGSMLKLPVYHTTDGRNLQSEDSLNKILAEAAMVHLLDWGACVAPLAQNPEITHGISFGPGDGVDAMTAQFVRGKGITLMNVINQDKILEFKSQAAEMMRANRKWEDYAPVPGTLPDGSEFPVNEFTKFTGRFPIFGGGMTPTSVEADIIVESANSGYIVEWAGGGQVTEEILIKRLDDIRDRLKPGAGIIFNFLYLDAYLWKLQFPLLLKLRKMGYPIEGATISAGIPDPKEAIQILDDLEEAGIWINSFKPGTIDQIKQTINIAKQIPDRKLIIQVEGGLAGGHHSWENLEDVISETYRYIRAQSNLILTVGGGIYTPEQAAKWLQGTWNSEQLMPVDGVIIGTILMACRESKAAETIKKKMAEIKGGENWSDTKNGDEVGGIVSGKSGLGADIYYASNHWTKLSARLEKMLKGKKSEQAAELVKRHRESIIADLNRTVKPYFGDLKSMTYYDVLKRFDEFVRPGERLRSTEGPWPDEPFIDISFRTRLEKLFVRFENRFALKNSTHQSSLLNTKDALNNFDKTLDQLADLFPEIKQRTLLPEDADFFYTICALPGKPVNFVAKIDENIIAAMRSDSLWYSHCVDIDPDSCPYIPGPVAIQGIKKVNEPVAEIFNNFKTELNKLLKSSNSKNGHTPQLERVSCNQEFRSNPVSGITTEKRDATLIVTVHEETGVSERQWLDHLAGLLPGNIGELLYARQITSGKNRQIANLFKFFSPELNRRFEISYNSKNRAEQLEVISSYNSSDITECAVSTDGKQNVKLTHFYRHPSGETIELERSFIITNAPEARVHELPDEDNQAGLDFYRRIWGLEKPNKLHDINSEFSADYTLAAEDIFNFRRATGEFARNHLADSAEITGSAPPANMAIVIAWRPLMSALFVPEARGDIFKLLHLNHEYEFTTTDYQNLRVGDTITTRSKITAIELRTGGKEVSVTGHFFLKKGSSDEPFLTFRSSFFLRGDYSQDQITLFNCEPSDQEFLVASQAEKEFLLSQPGVKLKADSFNVGDQLQLKVTKRLDRVENGGAAQYLFQGDFYRFGDKIGEIKIDEKKSSLLTNPGASLIEQFKRSDEDVQLPQSYLMVSDFIQAPQNMANYSAASLDANPIHTDSNFAAMAGLPEPIVHGMWTSAQALRLVTERICDGHSERLLKFRSNFEAPVLPGETLIFNAHHRAMNDGQIIIEIEALNRSKNRVYQGIATLRAPSTAYIFTGQGSQSQGMGMKFYDKYNESRNVWSRAEKVATEELGFSLLDIVKNNPTEITVAGEKWLHADGAINLTQFTQTGLVVKAIADWEVLKASGVLVKNAAFAGHSLGEYSALACLGVLPLEAVLKIVYHRGLTMQTLVPRDEKGRSPFAMSVVFGNRLIGLNEEKICAVVDQVRKESGKHLEVVNYNIRDKQYSVTGYIEALDLMEKRFSEMARGHRIFLRLDGIDVPFHSSLLLSGVDDFRKVLEQNLPLDANYNLLEGCYIPNLVARPYEINEEFFKLVQKVSGSNILKDILKKGMDSYPRNELQRTMLIELLAYQFANPVQWIKTQSVFFDEMKVKRVIDIGARGDLAGMARQTLKEVPAHEKPQILHVEENSGLVFYEQEGVTPVSFSESNDAEIELESESAPTAQAAPAQTAAPAPAAPTPVAAAPGGGEPLADRPLSKMDALLAVLAHKAGIRIDEINTSDNIENLFGGNSSKRNQVLAELGAEFNTSALDGAQEKPLTELAGLLDKASSYERPGPYLRVTFDEMIKNFMPPGFGRNEIFKHLREERLMPDTMIFGASNYLPLMSRSGNSNGSGSLSPLGLEKRLGSAGEAREWLDKATDSYGALIGTTIPSKSAQAAAGAGAAVATVDAAALEELEQKYFGVEGAFYQIYKYSRTAITGEDPYQQFLQHDREELHEIVSPEVYKEEHGETYDRSLAPRFNEKKVVEFNNSLQWAKKNLLKSFWDIHNGKASELSAAVKRQCQNNVHPDLLAAIKYMIAITSSDSLKKELSELQKKMEKLSEEPANFYPIQNPVSCTAVIDDTGYINFSESDENDINYQKFISALNVTDSSAAKRMVEIQITEDNGNSFKADNELNQKFVATLGELGKSGASFRGLSALVTGAGENSIAIEVVKNLLAGGMEVILTTSSLSDAKLQYYKRVYQANAGQGARLTVVPFSQGSTGDIKKLTNYIFEQGYEPDYLIPFGAIGEENAVTTLAGESLASLRVMLLGVNQLIGEFALQYKKRFLRHKRFKVMLPLSPNHGIFGRDGMYAETKLALEALFRKWFSENEEWGRFCSLIGCRIGWVRGTGLMELNNIVAPELEKECSIKTFSQPEMAFLLTGLVVAAETWATETPVLLGELSGGLNRVKDLNLISGRVRSTILTQAKNRRELGELNARYTDSTSGEKTPELKLEPLSPINSGYPELPDEKTLKEFATKSKLNPEKLICVVGMGEVSPGGSFSSRWEIEKDGELSIEGAIELAWMMGFVEYKQTPKGYTWTETDSGSEISETEIKKKYEAEILKHTGIRMMNPEYQIFDSFEAPVYTDIVLEDDFYIPASSEEEAREFKAALPDETSIYFDAEKDKWFVRRKKGTTIKVVRAVKLSRYVSGQIPDGWDPSRYGIPRDLINQVDRITLYNIIATCEAFLRAGIEPFELYRYIHPGQVGITSGSGLGGMLKLGKMFHDFKLGKPRQHDALQEALINVTAAWVITSLVGSAGPIQTPVSACATGGISIDMAVNILQEKKARFIIAGAFDDLCEEGAVGFGDMNATVATDDMLDQGIPPERMCRPNDSRRGGFLESQGGGTILLARGDLALEMGLPVYGIVAYCSSHSDGIQASIPAPGQGLINAAAEAGEHPHLSPAKRKNIIDKIGKSNETLREIFKEDSDEIIEALTDHFTHDYWKGDSRISPLRGALSIFDLTADDIQVVYKHDTSTKANDYNENRLHNNIQLQMGRTYGNPLTVVSQKYLTGHSKGGAACWQFNGLLQCLNSGSIPGNRNLENVDPGMNGYQHIWFTDETINIGLHRLKAGVLTTLGFGHVGAICLLVHPNFFLTALTATERKEYLSRRRERETYSIWRQREIMMENGEPMYTRKMKGPYRDDNEETKVYLNPLSRINDSLESYTIPE